MLRKRFPPRPPRRGVDVVLALGFDLFFKPRISAAAQAAQLEVRYASPQEALAKAAGASRVVADVSVQGVEEALASIREAWPTLPILACYPHVEAQRAQRVEALGGIAVTRGRFSEKLQEALAGTLS